MTDTTAILMFDQVLDLSMLSAYGSHCVNHVRIRFSNVKGYSLVSRDFDTTRHIGSLKTISDAQMREVSNSTFHRYMYVLLRDVIKAPRARIDTDRTIYIVLVLSIVAEQPQDRNILA